MLLNCGVEEDSARRSNQSILKEISPWRSLEGLMLKLKFQYFGHLMRRVDSLEKTLMLGGIGARRRRGRQRMRWLDGITDSMAEEHVDQCCQFRRWLQHGEGVQHVVGLADGLVGGFAGCGQLTLALSGEVRLRLGIAGASSALRSACTALPR